MWSNISGGRQGKAMLRKEVRCSSIGGGGGRTWGGDEGRQGAGTVLSTMISAKTLSYCNEFTADHSKRCVPEITKTLKRSGPFLLCLSLRIRVWITGWITAMTSNRGASRFNMGEKISHPMRRDNQWEFNNWKNWCVENRAEQIPKGSNLELLMIKSTDGSSLSLTYRWLLHSQASAPWRLKCDWPPVALGSAGGRGPAQPPPLPAAAWERKSHRGCKAPSGGFIHRHEIWTQASFERVPAYLRARKVNRRSALTLPPQTWRHSSAERAEAAVSLYSLSALLLLVLILFYFGTGCVQIAGREPCGVYLCWAPGLAQWEWGEMWAQSTPSEGNEKPKEFTSETVDRWGQGYPKRESFSILSANIFRDSVGQRESLKN